MSEVRNGKQKEHNCLYPEKNYGGQKLHEYFSSLLTRVTSLLRAVRISAYYVTTENLNARINPSSHSFYFLEGFCFRFDILKIQLELTAVGMNST